jgi:hypothetical protein
LRLQTIKTKKVRAYERITSISKSIIISFLTYFATLLQNQFRAGQVRGERLLYERPTATIGNNLSE